MQMMYETIYKALVEVGLEDAFSPQDYLNFYCLGNREEFSDDESAEGLGAGTPQVQTSVLFCFSRSFLNYYTSIYKLNANSTSVN